MTVIKQERSSHVTLWHNLKQKPLNRRQANDQSKKDNPFKKAFKWYTQERLQSTKNEVCPGKCEFAEWLDGKYFEYLRDSGQQAEPPMSQEPRPPNLAPVDCQPCPPCPGNKKFARIKSPWRKRRRPGNDAGDVPEKGANKSCEFLLKPKDLSRAASDNCYNTSGGKSNATVTSSNVPCNMKYSTRSHSLSDVGRESVPKHCGTVPYNVHEGSRYQEQAPIPLPSCVCTQEQVNRTPSKKNLRKQAKIVCECGQEKANQKQKVSEKQKLSNQFSTIGTCPQDKITEIKKTSSRGQDPCCKCRDQEVSEIEKVPLDNQDSRNKPRSTCKCHQEKVQKVDQVPSQKPSQANQRTCCKRQQEEVSEAELAPKEQDSTSERNQVHCKCRPEKVLKVEQVPSKQVDPINLSKSSCKCQEEKAPKEPKYQFRLPCCVCQPAKVAEVVQVPSQLKTAEESVQVPQEKVVSVNEETQYEPARPEPIHNTQNAKPCCCNNCKAPIPPSPKPQPMLCIPLMVQSNTLSSPEIGQVCSTTSAAQNNRPKKQSKVEKPDPSCQCCGKKKSKVDTQSHHQNEPCSCVCQKGPASVPRKLSTLFMQTVCQKEVTAACPIKQNQPSVYVCQKDTKVTAPYQINQSQCQHKSSVHICQKDTKVTAACSNDFHEVSQVFGPIPTRRESYSTVTMNEETGEFSIMKEVAVVSKFTRSVTCVSNEAAQTSDHSIQFEKDGTCCHYPLFFKLIYADVLKNECCN